MVHSPDTGFTHGADQREVFRNTKDHRADPVAPQLLREIFYGKSDTVIIIFMGPPGVGKTTFLHQLTQEVTAHTTHNQLLVARGEVLPGTFSGGTIIQRHLYDVMYTDFERDHGPDSTWTQETRTAFSQYVFSVIKQICDTALVTNQHEENKPKSGRFKHVHLFEFPAVPVHPYRTKADEINLPIAEIEGAAPDRCASTLSSLAAYLQEINYNDSQPNPAFTLRICAFAADERVQNRAGKVRKVVDFMSDGLQRPDLAKLMLAQYLQTEKVEIDDIDQISVEDIVLAFQKMAPTEIIKQMNGFIDEDIDVYLRRSRRKFNSKVEITSLAHAADNLTPAQQLELKQKLAYYLCFFEEVGFPASVTKAVLNLLIEGTIHIGGLWKVNSV